MNTELMEEVRKQVNQAIGALTLVKADNLDKEQDLFLNAAISELVGTVQGLSIIIDAKTNNPPEKEHSNEAIC